MIDTAIIGTVAPHFAINGRLLDAQRYGTGHINETYVARYQTSAGIRSYIHQKINSQVFTDVPALMDNIGRVTRHVRGKLERRAEQDIERRVLSLVPTIVATDCGADVFYDEDGCWWRTYVFIEDARTYDVIDVTDRAYQAAKAFGLFIATLADLGGKRLHETIAGFHDTSARFEAFLAALARDPLNRAKFAQTEIAFALRNDRLVSGLADLARSGVSRECVTHNDTKLNNVMIDDATGEGVCVIDLDTVMPGLALFDFGDMVRTAATPVAEDENDISLVEVQAPMFVALARGFVEGAGAMLASAEREHLVTAGQVATFECGLRFLTDYLLGDAYFRIHRPEQNLDRTRTQFALIDSLSRHEELLTSSVVGLVQT